MNRLRIAWGPGRNDAYPVVFCDGVPSIARELSRIAGGALIVAVTDRTVDRHHGKALRAALDRAGSQARWLVVPPGEGSKSRATRDRLEDAMIGAGAERSSVVAAVGGGVVGDLAGFAASTVFRGLRFVQVPTSLVAQVDSSIGAKVGIDHPLGKNLLGAIHRPEAVLTCTRILRTLPDDAYLQGIAEVVKAALVLDGRFAAILSASSGPLLSRSPSLLDAVVRRACRLKGRVVANDEREAGVRRLLNFGHTVGHAVELASGYRIPHGLAVAIGMAAETEIAVRLGIADRSTGSAVNELLARFGLPTRIPRRIDRAAVVRAIAFDKKKNAGRVRFTLIERIGRGVCGVDVPRGVLLEALAR